MGRTYAHIFRYVSCDIGHNKTNRRTIQIADGQLDAINPPYHLPNTCLSAISASRNGEFSSAFSGAIAPIRQAQPPLDLTHVFFGRARIVARHGGLYSLSAWRETPWSRSTSASTSSRCPRYRTCCSCRLPCAGSRVGGRGNIRIADVAPRFRRGGRRSAMP